KDAALTIIKINKIAVKYRYQIKDCHSYNIVFENCVPKYIDLGGFIKVKDNDDLKSLFSYQSFKNQYIDVLKLWAAGNNIMARSLLHTFLQPRYSEFLYFKFPALRLLNPDSLNRIIKKYYQFIQYCVFPDSNQSAHKLSKNLLFRIFLFIFKTIPYYFLKPEMSRLESKLQKLNLRKIKTDWSDYNENYFNKISELETLPRFAKIIEYIKKFNIQSFTEFGGNCGLFAVMVNKNCSPEKYFCSDYDEYAIDFMYNRSKNDNFNLTPVLLNPLSPHIVHGAESPDVRMKTDCVIAMALMHHLLLGQNYPIVYILKKIMSYTKKYIFIEFMPFGRYNPSESRKKNSEKPPLPEWYNIDWFRAELSKYFDIIFEGETAENRILFFGKLITLNKYEK
nr:hypothetical protein [bacterium]